jgi:cell division protein FtsN
MPTSRPKRRPTLLARRTGEDVDASALTSSRRRSLESEAGTGGDGALESKSESSDEDAEEPAPRQAKRNKMRYALQVGAFTTEAKAKSVATDLRSKGLSAKVDENADSDRVLYRVRVGSFEDNHSASAAARQVSSELGYKEIQVVKY